MSSAHPAAMSYARITTLGRGLEDDIDAVKELKISFHVNAPSTWTVSTEKHRSYKPVYAEGF